MLNQKNNGKRTPLEMAQLLINRRAIQIIQDYLNNNRQKYII